VRDGIALGTRLGKRLQIRGEVKVTKFTRLPKGKIDRRLLSSIGYQGENLFYQTAVDKYKPVHLHLSVDGSGSMASAWKKTMTMLVAIAKAASMTNNVGVSISFRTGALMARRRDIAILGLNESPYVVMAYDSRVDKFEKIVRLFPLLYPNGSTPEGLAFQAILKQIPPSTYELNSYFVNLSDGEPAFGRDRFYQGESAANHTKKQVGKIREKGIEVLSYFIEDTSDGEKKTERIIDNEKTFKTMYGKDAQFIDVENVIQIAHTMNKKFLVREN
jgi:nitric oxide reductase activation protein